VCVCVCVRACIPENTNMTDKAERTKDVGKLDTQINNLQSTHVQFKLEQATKMWVGYRV
jgi:hypothetical protein